MRLGCLPYLNVRPLVHTLEQGGLPEGWELVYAPPSVLAEMLLHGEIAAAPVSSFACFTNPPFGICPDICISADGPVQSVLMLSKVPVEQVGTVSLDTSSLSGANMLKVILAESYDLHPAFTHAAPDSVPAMLESADAAMVIGDPAMLCPKDGLRVFDLALEWKKLTGLPAVFAVWAGQGITPQLTDVLREAKREGLSLLPEISRQESRRLGLPYDVCCDYLSKTITYDFGQRQQQGFELFRRKCVEHGLIGASG